FTNANSFTLDGITYTISGTDTYSSTISNNAFSPLGDDASDYYLLFDLGGLGGISSVQVKASDSSAFQLLSFSFDALADANVSVTPSGGSAVNFASNGIWITQQNQDFSANAEFQNITSFTITGGNITLDFDDLNFGPAVLPAPPAITSAIYDASTGELVVTGTNLKSTVGAANDISANAFTFTGEGGETYTLINTANIDISSATNFSMQLSATDQAALGMILNKGYGSNGSMSSTGGTTYNLAAAEDWNTGANAADTIIDTTGNGIKVLHVPTPEISYATYNAKSGALVVTGSSFTSAGGAANDIGADNFTFLGEGGRTYTLNSTADVDIASGTLFTLTLSAADRAAVNLFINKIGISSTNGTTYNLSASEDWAQGTEGAVSIGDTTSNVITASNVAVPTITNATYNMLTRALVVSGTGLLISAGPNNDIIANKFTFTGEGGSTWQLNDTANVDISSGTSFTLILGISDQSTFEVLATRNGTVASTGTLYNLAAADNWEAGADARLIVTDATGNGITVSHARPTVTDANIHISGASGTGGAYKIGDTVTATWNNTASGDNNSDPIIAVSVYFGVFGKFGGGPVAATNSADTWTATYTITPGSIDTINLNVSVSADNATGGSGMLDSSNATVDNIAPTTSSVSVPANATYTAGQNLDFTVNTSEPITVNTVTGTPRIALTVGATTRYADYLSGSGTTAIVFRYTIQSGDNDSDGIVVAPSFDLNGGTLRDDAGNDLDTTLNAVDHLTGVLVDALAPTITSVSVPTDGVYGAGENLDFTVNFDENVTVNTSAGTPRIAITLDTGGTVYADYQSGSGSSALSFRYTVQAADDDNDGIIVGTLNTDGGTIKDSADNAAVTTLNSVGSTSGVLVHTPTANLNMDIDNSQDYARYGKMLDYVVTIDNSGDAVTQGVSVNGNYSTGFFLGAGHWQCFGGGSQSVPTLAHCTPSIGSGALSANIDLPVGASLTFLVSVPVDHAAVGDDITFSVNAIGGSNNTNLSASDTDTLVIFRDGFDVPYANGALRTKPPLGATATATAACNVTLGQRDTSLFAMPQHASEALIDDLLTAHAADGSRIAVQRLNISAAPWLRLLTTDTSGREHASIWASSTVGAELALGLADDGTDTWLLLEGSEPALRLLKRGQVHLPIDATNHCRH
ncbi:MAG: hypothetical protein L0H70_02540, partial [Xanthomonadales bacterium]|nr:hypothetical protein [Xanthomonadales bacterium]